MNTEVGFLVFILYFVLFLDLYATFEKLFCANGGKNAKKAWQLRRNCLDDNVVGRETLTVRKFMDVKPEKQNMGLPQIALRHEISLPCLRANGQIAAVQKARLWGRT